MTYDEAKQWLYEARRLENKKRYHLDRIDEIAHDCQRIREGRGAVLCVSIKKRTVIHDPTSDSAIAIVDKLAKNIDHHTIEIWKAEVAILKIERFIEGMYEKHELKEQEFDVLKNYFFDGKDNNQTAKEIGYSVESVWKYKKRAIEKVARKLSFLEEDKAS